MKLLAGGIDKPLIRYTYMRRGKRQGKGSQTSRSADLAKEGGQQQENMLKDYYWRIRFGCLGTNFCGRCAGSLNRMLGGLGGACIFCFKGQTLGEHKPLECLPSYFLFLKYRFH